MKKLTLLAALVIASAGFATPSHAQLIAWGSANNMVTDTDVQTNGSYFDAASFFGADTVNTVSFNALTGSGVYTDASGHITVNAGNGTFGGNSFTGGSTNYKNLVADYGFTFTYAGSVVLSGLTSGQEYQVQVWDAASGGNHVETYSGSPTVTVDSDLNQYAIGTFTATSSSVSFNYNPATYYGIINAVSVRDITAATPEPSTWALMLGGMAILVVMSRRRALNRI